MKIRVSNGMHQRNIDLPLSDSELTRVMKSIGVTSIIPYCTLNVAWGDNNPLRLLEKTQVNMDEINFFAKRMENLTEYEQEVLSVYAERNGLNEMKELINLAFCMPGLSLIKDFSNVNRVGKQLYIDEYQGLSETEREKGNVNYIEFADKILASSRVDVSPYGVLVQHGFDLQELYDGKNLPLYFYKPDCIVAVLEVCNRKGASEYLYLPTEINAFNKMKTRLSVESFSECTVKEVQNVHLPGSLLPKPEDVTSIEQLTAFNELCQNIYGLDEAHMEKLSLAAQFIGAKDYMDLTNIAKQLGDFEAVPGVHNDEEYGKFLVTDLFDVNELLLPHIDYAGVAADKRNRILVDSGYLERGFVGASKERHEYLQQYHGEYGNPLEFSLDDCEAFCLYSPLTGTLISGGEYSEREEYLSRYDLAPFESDIAEAIKEHDCIGEEPRGLMHYFRGSLDVARKVITAKPMVMEHEGELFGVLECMAKEPLTEEELSILKDYWIGQMRDDWGKGFEQKPIKVEEGELCISFWCSENSWSVMTEEELCQS